MVRSVRILEEDPKVKRGIYLFLTSLGWVDIYNNGEREEDNQVWRRYNSICVEDGAIRLSSSGSGMSFKECLRRDAVAGYLLNPKPVLVIGSCQVPVYIVDHDTIMVEGMTVSRNDIISILDAIDGIAEEQNEH